MLSSQSPAKQLLLISSSTVYGRGYLDHAEGDIRDVLGSAHRVLFIPFALFDRETYAAKARERFRRMGYDLESAHSVSDPQRLVADADAIFIGGGKNFPPLKAPLSSQPPNSPS